ncbi:sulfur carrier protein ThiS [bacterium]|nr:sulfur carrier protein ThiS [bacterium]
MAMTIQLNGVKAVLNDGVVTVRDVVTQFGLTAAGLIAELNGELIRSQDFGGHSVKNGDILELIQFMGGG